ncbi:MAG: YicC/YloC family endoribonuclease [Gemmatimonadota bacterium]
MTGYGAADGTAAGGRVRIEIRTVNHRYFNLSLKLPGDLSALEGELRERLRKEFERGHISLSIRWSESPLRGSVFALDLDRARHISDRLRELQTVLRLPGEVDLGLVLRQANVIVPEINEEVPVTWAELEPIVVHASAECKAMRRREGAALATELGHRLDLLEGGAARIAERAPERVIRERDRLRTAVAALLDGRPLDDARLAQEVAFLADKLDITEELVRFAAHVRACRAALAGEQAVGKQLGFLAQELGREVNTMGSKANDAEIVQHVIAMKGELEKFREQLENIE